MILITSFFKSFEFELNPIPKTDFLKENFEVIISILYPYHTPYWKILENSSKYFPKISGWLRLSGKLIRFSRYFKGVAEDHVFEPCVFFLSLYFWTFK